MPACTHSLVAFRSGFLHFLSFSSVSAASNGERSGSLANKFIAASSAGNNLYRYLLNLTRDYGKNAAERFSA